MVIKLLYCQPEVCVRVNGKQSPFYVGVGLRQGCVWSPLFLIIYMKCYMNWMDKLSQIDECVKIGRCKISRLLFADDLVLLTFLESGLQHVLMALQLHVTLLK